MRCAVAGTYSLPFCAKDEPERTASNDIRQMILSNFLESTSTSTRYLAGRILYPQEGYCQWNRSTIIIMHLSLYSLDNKRTSFATANQCRGCGIRFPARISV